MNTEQHFESSRAKAAFAAFVSMGPTRSLPGLLRLFRERKASGQSVPTDNHSTIKKWSEWFNWQERICLYHSQPPPAPPPVEPPPEPVPAVQDVLTEGVALKTVRLGDLNEIRKTIRADWQEASHHVHGGKRRLNTELARLWLAVLDDSAKEVGGRSAPAVQALMKMLEDERTGVARIIREELGSSPDAAKRVAARLVALVDSWRVQSENGSAVLRSATGSDAGAEGPDATPDQSGDEDRF